MKPAVMVGLFVVFLAAGCKAQERPYFVTYSHEMEEPGNLEIEFFNAVGKPPDGNRFVGSTLEFEYGAIRPLLGEHWINPVLYVEFENINGGDKALREVVGHDGKNDLVDPNPEARTEKKREMELKLILGSNFRGWNISENIIAEKNLANAPWEFGYAWAVSRPLKLAASAHDCTFCGEKFQAGVEMYGGLGDGYSFGTHLTSHYAGPTLNWEAPQGLTFSFSPQFGLNDYSVPRLYRFGIAYEIGQLWGRFHRGAR